MKDLVASALSPAMKSLPPAPPALLVGSNEDFIAQAERELAGLAPREVPGFLSRLLPEARRRELLGGGDLVERVATLVTARAASKDPARTARALAGMVREARAAVTGLDAAFTGAAAAVRIDPLFGGDAAARARVEACLRAWSASASAPPLVLAVGDASVDRPSAERAVRGLLGPGAERAVLLLQKEAPLARDGRLLHDRVEAAARLPLGTLFGVSKGDWDREDLLNLLLPGALVLRAGESLDRAIREFTATLTFA